MVVEVFYHIYKHNQDDLAKVRVICEDLGFTFRFRHAALAPLDNIEAIIENRETTLAVRQTRDLQLLKVESAMTQARLQKDRECFYERYLWITWDLEVSQCMEYYEPGLKLVPDSFLDTTLADIAQARQDSEFCHKCKERAIHQCYIVYGDENLIDKKHYSNPSKEGDC